MNILDQIVANKFQEIRVRKAKMPLAKLEKKIERFNQQRDFVQSITSVKVGGVSLIAELKLASPFAGILGSKEDIINRAQEYYANGADAISIVTDKKFFNGELDFVREVKNFVAIPVLQKDFVIDEYQLYEAKFLGTDAVLLIAEIVGKRKLRKLAKLAVDLNLEPVIEVTDERELEEALLTAARCIGVNARNLKDFTIDISKACALGKKIPPESIFIGFSGVSTRAEVEDYRRAGAKAVLVGTCLMRERIGRIGKIIRELKGI